MSHATCPGCSGKLTTKPVAPTAPLVFSCRRCGGIVGRCWLGESYRLVKPFFSPDEVPADRLRYFDLECLGSAGIVRRHGWYDPTTGYTVQVG